MSGRQLTRDDFDNLEDWYRYCHQSGIEPFNPEEPFYGIKAEGFYGALAGAIFGHTRREYQRSWEGWGESDYLQTKQFRKAYRAVAFANCRGRLMNTPIAISWKTVGIESDVRVLGCQKLFFERARKWLLRRGLWPAWIWTLERGSKYGLHTHILISLPSHLSEQFRAFAKSLLASIVRQPLLDTRESKTFLMVCRRGVQIEPQWKEFTYLMKGLDPRYGWETVGGFLPFQNRVGVNVRRQGKVSLKRLGVSRELDAASFARWSELNDFPSTAITGDAGEPLYDDRFWRWFEQNGRTLTSPF